MLQVSALVPPSDLQSLLVLVGALPNFAYRSASPVPPEVTNFRPVAPAGTASVQTWLPVSYTHLTLPTSDLV